MKAGWKTTEFWIALASLITIFVAIFTDHTMDIATVGAITTIVVGFQASRPVVKSKTIDNGDV